MKMISFFMFLTLISSAFPDSGMAARQNSDAAVRDTGQDEAADLRNAVAILRICAGTAVSPGTDRDMNNDGRVGLEDAVAALRFAAGLSLCETAEGIRLCISADSFAYSPGETAGITATAENLGESPITCMMGNIGEPPIYIITDTGIAGLHSLRHPDDPEGVATANDYVTLGPGEKFVRQVFWDQMIFYEPRSAQAPPGNYETRAVFNLVEEEGDPYTEATPLDVTITVTLEGGDPIISQKEALDIALGEPEVRAWFEANEGIVCDLTDAYKYVVFSEGQWKTPEKGVSSGDALIRFAEGPLWWIYARSSDGPAGSPGSGTLSVLMNARDGSVLEVEIMP